MVVAATPSGEDTVPALETLPEDSDVLAEIVIGGNDPPGDGMVPLKTQLTTVLADRSVQVQPVPLAADAVTPVAIAWLKVGSRDSAPLVATNEGVAV